MFRFSCFHSPTHSQKTKKTVQLPTEMMQKTLEDDCANQPTKDSIFLEEVPEGDNANQSPSSIGQDWKSEGLKSTKDTDSDDGEGKMGKLRKSVSLGSGLARYQGMTSGDELSSNHSESGVQVDDNEEYQKAREASDSLQISSNLVNHESDPSPDYPEKSEKEACENSETRFSGECIGGSSTRSPCTPHSIVKTSSLPFLRSAHANLIHQSRSSEDLKALGSRRNNIRVDDGAGEASPDPEGEDDNVGRVDKTDGDDGDDAYDYVGSAKDWIIPAVDELSKGKNVHEDYSVCRWEELPNEDFKIKRIEKWVMDLQHCSSLEEASVLTNLDHNGQNGKNTILDPMTASGNDAKALLGMDAAKRYISTLSSSATAAHLANHGLAVIPFLSAFPSLRALNLSGNSIVRINAGALPRGLHILNLSKNNISTIEGLRELTRLRVLDLSYNRILRIGHGLASCSSLKELYLAGNKISEVEGLHRLLKLNVLDLRFNKLSTTKSLGQLAANYNSLQAISLEGNPAQKNIGDEQLKKFLLGLLPHLAYFNRQSIKSGAMKDSADRAARLGISAHQIDRGLRSESKKSTHGRKSQPVPARGRHLRLPPSGVKMTTDRHHFHDMNSRILSFRPDLAIRRTHSEGLLKAV